MANFATRGMPLLSGPPPGPDSNEDACRKCNKEFNLLFARSRRCNHCGHLYCQSCADFQALMPRQGESSSQTGYDPVPVCALCIENLNITAAGKGQLRGYSLAKLRKYAKDYNINVNGVVEKDDLIDRLIAIRGPNGCLPPSHEKHYRIHSVPRRSSERSRGFFTRARETMNPQGSPAQQQQSQQPPYQPRSRTTSHPSSFPRPDLEPDQPYHQERPSQQPSRNSQSGNTSHQPQANATRNAHTSSYPQADPVYRTYNPHDTQHRPQPAYNPPPGPPPQAARPNVNLNVPPPSPRPRTASAPRPRPPAAPSRATSPAPPIPTLDELLEMSEDAVQKLSISVLKAVLFRNHVNTGMIVEKAELVVKVQTLITDERLEREATARRQAEEDAELREALDWSRREHEEQEAARQRAQSGSAGGSQGGQSEGIPASSSAEAEGESTNEDGPMTPPHPPEPKATTPKLTPKAQAMASHLERTGLCVICQDEEANIAIVDCGHLAMCRACSELIMQGTRECPLCRTRIVTEARLLRIFKA